MGNEDNAHLSLRNGALASFLQEHITGSGIKNKPLFTELGIKWSEALWLNWRKQLYIKGLGEKLFDAFS